eukprot:5458698-Pleurochrysis_carterae.AAC.1
MPLLVQEELVQLLRGRDLPDGCPLCSSTLPAQEVPLDSTRGQAVEGEDRFLGALLHHVPAVQAQRGVDLGLDRSHRFDIHAARRVPDNSGYSNGRGSWGLNVPGSGPVQDQCAPQLRWRRLNTQGPRIHRSACIAIEKNSQSRQCSTFLMYRAL